MSRPWFELTKKFFKTSHWLDIKKLLGTRMQQREVVMPHHSNIFRAFREVAPCDVKVVVLNTGPYTGYAKKDIQGNELEEPVAYADGLAFSCDSYIEAPRALSGLQNYVGKTFYKGEIVGPFLENDLTRLTRQGVLLLNASLTTDAFLPGSHNKYWRPFTEYVLKRFSSIYKARIYILCGKYAQTFKPFINDENFIIEADHPSDIKANIGLDHANNLLKIHSKKQITW